MAAVAAAVLLLALISGVGGGGGNKRHVVAASSGDFESTTTTDNNGGNIATPTTRQTPDTTAMSTTTSTAHGPTRNTTLPTRPPTTIPQTTVTTQLRDCTAHDVSLATTTDKPTYGPGEPVQFFLTSTNIASTPCEIPPVCGITPWQMTVADSTGKTVWVSHRVGVASPDPPPPPAVLQPGQSTREGPYFITWDQKDCSQSSCRGTQVPAGTYTAHGARDIDSDHSTATAPPKDFAIT